MKLFRVALALAGTCLSFTPLLAQDTRLSNLSVRTSAGGADILITGFTIGPGPDKTVLVRAVGPTLGVFGVPGTLGDPKLELYSGSTKIAENDNFNASDAPAFAAVGAFPLGAGAKDAALVATLAPGSYSAQVTGLSGTSGVALVEVYEVTGGATRLINLSTRAQVGTGANLLIPGITIAPGAGTRRLLLRAVGPTLGAFGVPGTLADPKLELYSGSTKIAENDNWGTPTAATAADAATLAAAFTANGAFPLADGSKDAALLLNLSAGSYSLQVSGVGATTGAALVEVYDLTPVNQTGARPNASLYVAQLRPDPTATGSTASGYATVLINADGTASVTVRFSNLSSAQTAAQLALGGAGDYVLNLPRDQVNGITWTFSPSGAHTTNDLINALNSGNIFVVLGSARNPAGELRGNFVVATGSQAFAVPVSPPALPNGALAAPSATDAARFLTQATFGPTFAEIERVLALGLMRWIDEQMGLPATSHLAGLLADVAEFPNPPPPPTIIFKRTHVFNRHTAEWKIMMTAPDQLRQRVAFALSQIFVVSETNDRLSDNAESLAAFHDILTNGAFGSFRGLLEQVSLSPAMGWFLSHISNVKANLVTGSSPDENYAREIQQLFTIGLVQLHPDGTLMLDAAGEPIPTYDQAIITETAKVFTGWTFNIAGNGAFGANPATTSNLPTFDPANGWLVPMRYSDAQHDKTEKRVVSSQQVPLAQASRTVIPANQTGPQDLKVLLDTLAGHPNTGPFIGRQLIQRLVTSNPSPAYVYRVAQVFANDGSGVRGNLGAVVRAILTDYEARSPAVIGNVGYGKLKEPVIRTTGLFRALEIKAANGRYLDSWWSDPRNANGWGPAGYALHHPQGTLGQATLAAQSVFNFYSPDYSPPGALAAAGLVAPEMQITDAITAVTVPNFLLNWVYRQAAPLTAGVPTPSPFLFPDYAALLPNARNTEAILDQLNLLFCGGSMSTATRSRLATAHRQIATNPSPAVTDLERAMAAVHLVILSPDAAVQR
ncbi:MAG: DUF1800 family protein [Opitutaceae bacterium]|nr:DUF1800 family protein [Opitutaceae bacterium]